MYLNVDVFGDTQFSRELLNVADRARDMRPAWDGIHRSFTGAAKAQFDSEGLVYSGGWEALKPATVEAKANAGLDPRILHATLRLRRSLTSPTSPDHVFRSDPEEMFVGSRVAYGKYHQFGTKNMPRRRPVELDESIKKRWVKLMQRYIIQGDAIAAEAELAQGEVLI